MDWPVTGKNSSRARCSTRSRIPETERFVVCHNLEAAERGAAVRRTLARDAGNHTTTESSPDLPGPSSYGAM